MSKIAMPTYTPSGGANPVVSMLNNWSNNQSDDRLAMLRLEQQDKQFQLNQQRQNRLDSLAQAAVTREEARYQERRTDAKDAEMNTLNASLAAARGETIPVNMYNSEQVEDKSNITGRVFDTDLVDKNKTNIPMITDLKLTEVNDIDKKFLSGYNKINDNNELTSYQKRQDLKDYFIKSGGTQAELDDADNNLISGTKAALRGLGTVGDSILTYNPVMSAARLISDEADSELDNYMEEGKKQRDEFFKKDDPLQSMKTRAMTISKDIEDNNFANNKYRKELSAQTTFLDKLKKNTFGKKEIFVPKEQKEFLTDIDNKIKNELATIPNNLSKKQKIMYELAIRSKYKPQLDMYATLKKESKDRKISKSDKIFISQLEASKQKSINDRKHEQKLAEIDYKRNPKSIEAKTRLDNANAALKEFEIKNK